MKRRPFWDNTGTPADLTWDSFFRFYRLVKSRAYARQIRKQQRQAAEYAWRVARQQGGRDA